jgi:hypothetical protein
MNNNETRSKQRTTCRRCSHSWMWHGYGEECDFVGCICSKWNDGSQEKQDAAKRLEDAADWLARR